jgi:hypothetical protein
VALRESHCLILPTGFWIQHICVPFCGTAQHVIVTSCFFCLPGATGGLEDLREMQVWGTQGSLRAFWPFLLFCGTAAPPWVLLVSKKISIRKIKNATCSAVMGCVSAFACGVIKLRSVMDRARCQIVCASLL